MFVIPLAYPLPRRAFHPGWARSLPDADTPLRPAMDASENDQAYSLSFDLPGITREQIEVTIEGRDLRVEAKADDAVPGDGARVLRRERHAPRYARRIELGSEVDAEAASARFANGVLTLRLPKRQLAGARKLEVL